MGIGNIRATDDVHQGEKLIICQNGYFPIDDGIARNGYLKPFSHLTSFFFSERFLVDEFENLAI